MSCRPWQSEQVCCVLISLQQRLAVTGGDVFFIAVALRAFFDDGTLELFAFNGFDGMNVAMAVPTAKILLDVMEV